MENRKNKTAQMLIHKIEWIEVSEILDVNPKTLLAWRESNDTNKHEAIDYGIAKVVKNKEVKN